MIKTIKIPEQVHKELKVYVSRVGSSETIESVTGYAVMLYLQSVGHKFEVKPKIKNK